MRGRLIVVTGTGTEIGKTHVAEAILLAWRRATGRVIGLKPIESGVATSSRTDAKRLAAASSFHVKQFGVAFSPALSPHLAARDEGTVIPLPALKAGIEAVRREADGLLVELPGGLFTPLSDDVRNADWAQTLDPDLVVLVAPDRLGVLHDVIACAAAARTVPLPIGAVVLVWPERPDASTGRNASELSRLVPIPVLPSIPRGTPEALSELPGIQLLIRP